VVLLFEVKPVSRFLNAHVDSAGRAAFDHIGRGSLLDGELGEQLSREQVQVHFAVGILGVRGACGGDRDWSPVQQNFGEVRAEAADRDISALAVDVARDGDTRNAVEGLGDVGVREFADILCVHLVDEADRFALRLRGLRQALAITGDYDFLELTRRGGGGGARRPAISRRLGILALCCTGTDAQADQTYGSTRTRLSIFHETPSIGKNQPLL
jgi:hypothetical protein